MAETVLSKDALALAEKNLLAYFDTHDVQYVAENAVFKHMSTGEEYKGRAEVGALLHYMYHVAFDAKAEVKNHIITEDKAFVEGLFKGRHIGEFAGIQATQKEVSVPLAVSYTLQNGLIREARIFMANDVLLQQLGATAGAARPKTTYVTRDIFHLKFGHFREVKALMQEAFEKGLFSQAQVPRVYSDFTGDAYRLICEEDFASLGDYEKSLSSELNQDQWQQWYERFKPHVERSYREILKQVL